MLFTREALATSLSDRLHLFADILKTRSRNGRTDLNHSAETIMARFLNALFGWELQNRNVEQLNFPGIDLGDPERKIAFQITNKDSSNKITRTTGTAEKRQLGKSYSTLIILFLLSQKPGLPKTFVQPAEGPEIETWDLHDLLGKMLDIEDLAKLQAASAVLDEEGIPGPWQDAPAFTHVPALPTVPPKPAQELFGRDADLAEVLRRFTERPRLALTGDGGLGKTALSAALLQAWRDFPAAGPSVGQRFFSHDFYKAPTLIDFHSGILAQAGLRSVDSQNDPALAAHVLRQPGVILYVEGAERLPDLAALLDLIGPDTALLLTTRHPGQTGDLPAFPVAPLAEHPAGQLLHHHAVATASRFSQIPYPHGIDASAWSLLARDLGGHPLACELAGIHCGKHSKSPAAFHHQLIAQGLTPLSKGRSGKVNLDILWRSAAAALLAELPGAPSPALHAWHCLTLGGTNLMPASVLRALGAADEHAFEVLMDHGLVTSASVPAETEGELEPAYALTHALLSEWGKRQLPAFHPSIPDLLPPAMAWGEALFQEVSEHCCVPGGPARYLLLHPLASALLTAVQGHPTLPLVHLHLCYDLPARIHELHGQYAAAEPFYRDALAAMQTASGPDAPITAAALNNLAQFLQNTNRMAEAEHLLREALRIKETIFGKDHSIMANSLDGLAILLQSTNRRPEAEPLLREALRIREAKFGRDHPTVANSLNNLAVLLQATKRADKAEPLMREVLRIFETKFGKDHPSVATAMNNLAELLKAAHRPYEAEPLMREALRIRQATFGRDHPDVATSLNNLASLLYSTNRLAEAEPLLREALRIDEVSYGNDHPHVANSLHNLGNVLQATNRLPEAEPLMRQGLEIFMRFTAATAHAHPSLKVSLRNYIALCSKMEVPTEITNARLREMAGGVGLEWPQVLGYS